MARVGVCIGARHLRRRPRVARLWAARRAAVSSGPDGGSTEMRSDTSRKILLKRVGEHLQQKPS